MGHNEKLDVDMTLFEETMSSLAPRVEKLRPGAASVLGWYWAVYQTPVPHPTPHGCAQVKSSVKARQPG